MHPKRPERIKRFTQALERPLEDSLVRIKALAQNLAHKVIAILQSKIAATGSITNRILRSKLLGVIRELVDTHGRIRRTMRDQRRKRILGNLASIAGLFQRELGHTAQHAWLFDLAGNKIAQRPEHGNLLAVGTVSHIDVLEHVRMRADNRIDTGIQENLAVLKLGFIGRIDILGTPMRKCDHKVGARFARSLDIAGQVAQVQLLDAPRSAIRQRNAVCMLGVVEQRDFDAAALDNMDGVCQLLLLSATPGTTISGCLSRQ